MKLYNLFFEQNVPISVDQAWEFFSSPANLSKITPPEMNFTITSRQDESFKMFPGMIVTYKVTPLKGVRLNWVTEITHVKEREYFIDEQRFGPYAFWKHQHRFVEIHSGVKIIDNLYYGLPLGIIGRATNALFVEKQIRNIFDYRCKKIVEMFGVYKA